MGAGQLAMIPPASHRAAVCCWHVSSPVCEPLSDLVDLFVFQRHESLDNEGEGVHALLDGGHALAFEDDDHSWAGGAPVERLHYALRFELFDDAHFVVDEWSELVWLGD